MADTAVNEAVASLLSSEPVSPHPPALVRADWRWFWAILGLAAVLRFAWFTGHVKTVYFSQPILDAQGYYETAVRIANRVEGFEASTFHPPLYSAVLGELYRILNAPVRLPITYLIQHGLGVLTVALVFFTAFRVAGRGPAIVASLLTATYGPLAAMSNDCLPIALIALEFIALLYFLICSATTRGIENLFLAGCVFALAALTYPGVYVFLPFALVRLCALPPPVRTKGAPLLTFHGDYLQAAGRWANPVAFLAAPVLVVVFYGIVTSAQTGHFTSVPWRGGVYFYLGNGHDLADGVFIRLPRPTQAGASPEQSPEETYAREKYPLSDSQPPSPWKIGAHWYAETLRRIAAHPGRWLALMAKKALLVLSQAEGYNHASYGFLRQINPFARFWPSTYGMIMLLALLGLRLAGNVPWPWPRHWTWIFLASHSLCLVLFLVDGRYRAPMVPVLAIVAGLGAQRIWRHLARPSRRRGAFVYGIPCVALLAPVIFVDWFGVAAAFPGRDWWRYAWAANEASEWDIAAQACDRAINLGENNPQVYIYRGNLYLRDGKVREALNAYEKAMLADPSHPRPYYIVAMMFLDHGEYAKAVSFLKTTLSLSPTTADCYAEYGLLALRAGDLKLALEHLQRANGMDENNVAALVGLAELSLRQGDTTLYEERFARASALDSAMAIIHRNRIRAPVPPECLKAPPFRIYRKLADEAQERIVRP